ncbi:MAG TPA: hypothetical protein VFP84_15175, partial [Kofleriaceae bacterium]|nr:hypothetical protein [Kofleriaceae bacterium]
PTAPTALAPTAPSALAPTALAPTAPTALASPEASPFFTGGAGAGTFPPNAYNPCGRGDNCGFTSMSYASHLQNPTAPLRDADELYRQLLAQLGIPDDGSLSRQLVFPQQSYDALRSRPGYEPLFTEDGNRLSEYTLPNAARTLGVNGREVKAAFEDWQIAFDRHSSIEDAVAARVEVLEHRGGRAPDPAAVRRWIEKQRRDLPGTYIVGTHASAHYMTLTIDQNGRITGFDPQNHKPYLDEESIQLRMKNEKFDLMFKVDAAGLSPGAP